MAPRYSRRVQRSFDRGVSGLQLEIGIHRFHHPNDPANIADAKFVTIWHDDNGVWKVTRVISYEHNEGLLAK